MNVIEIQELCKQFTGKRMTRVDALRELSMAIWQGEIFGLLGHNGAGKSTTIKCLMGLIRPTAGTVAIMGEPVRQLSGPDKVEALSQCGKKLLRCR